MRYMMAFFLLVTLTSSLRSQLRGNSEHSAYTMEYLYSELQMHPLTRESLRPSQTEMPVKPKFNLNASLIGLLGGFGTGYLLGSAGSPPEGWTSSTFGLLMGGYCAGLVTPMCLIIDLGRYGSKRKKYNEALQQF